MRDARIDELIRSRFGVYRKDAERWFALYNEAHPWKFVRRYVYWTLPVVAGSLMFDWMIGLVLAVLFLVPFIEFRFLARKADRELDELFHSNVPYWSHINHEFHEMGLI